MLARKSTAHCPHRAPDRQAKLEMRAAALSDTKPLLVKKSCPKLPVPASPATSDTRLASDLVTQRSSRACPCASSETCTHT